MASTALAVRLASPKTFRFTDVAQSIGACYQRSAPRVEHCTFGDRSAWRTSRRSSNSESDVEQLQDLAIRAGDEGVGPPERPSDASRSPSMGTSSSRASASRSRSSPKEQALMLPSIYAGSGVSNLQSSCSEPALLGRAHGGRQSRTLAVHEEKKKSQRFSSASDFMKAALQSATRNRLELVREEALAGLEGSARSRALLRREMVEKMRQPERVFRALDVNGSGQISLQDFASGLSALGIDWKGITGTKTERQLFELFYRGKKQRGAIVMSDMFPADLERQWADLVEVPPRPGTAEFWRTWCDKTDDKHFQTHRASWEDATPAKAVDHVHQAQAAQEEAAVKKKWVRATFRRLKGVGKSDARCRELTALHLPRGTGPADRQDVHTFSTTDVRECRRKYAEEVNEPAKTIQKAVYDMRDQRRALVEQKALVHKVVDPHLRAKEKEEGKKLPLFEGLEGLGGLFGKVSQAAQQMEASIRSEKPEVKSFAAIARDTGNACITEETLEDLYVQFCKHAHNTEVTLQSKANFVKLLEDLCPSRTFSASDIEVHWAEVFIASGGKPPKGQGSRSATKEVCAGRARHKAARTGASVSFETFAEWYCNSEFYTH